MSITTLVQEELQRQQSTEPNIKMMAAGGERTIKPKSSAAFEALARYVPTEVITLYIAAASAMAALKQTFAFVNEVNTYWFFIGFTPVIFLIVYAGQRRQLGLSVFPKLRKWPWWKLFSATVAFAIWALAVPTTPYLQSVGGGAIAAFLATFVSMGLSLLAPIFEPPSS